MSDKSGAPLTGQLDLYTLPASTEPVAILPDDISSLPEEDGFYPAAINPDRELSSQSYYEGLEEKEIKTLENIAKKIRSKHRNHFQTVYELGHLLTRAKPRFPGHFIEWLEERCEISIRSAQRYMSVYAFALEHVKAYRLPVSAIYECMRPGTPKDAVKELLDGVEDEIPPLAVIAMRLRKAREDCRRGAAKKANMTGDELEQAPDPVSVVADLIALYTPKRDRSSVRNFFQNAAPADLRRLADNVTAKIAAA